MRLREATAADIEGIAALHADSWRATYRGAYADAYLDGPVVEDRRREWQDRLRNPVPNQYVVVAEDSCEIVGFACSFGNESAENGTLLDNLHVRRDLHGHGIGKRLVIETAKWCAANYPETSLYLGVLEQNENAQQFYKRLGATDIGGSLTTPPGGGSVPFRIYAWTPKQVAEMAAGPEPK